MMVIVMVIGILLMIGGNDDGMINALKVPPAVSKRIVLYVNCKSPIKI